MVSWPAWMPSPGVTMTSTGGHAPETTGGTCGIAARFPCSGALVLLAGHWSGSISGWSPSLHRSSQVSKRSFYWEAMKKVRASEPGCSNSDASVRFWAPTIAAASVTSTPANLFSAACPRSQFGPERALLLESNTGPAVLKERCISARAWKLRRHDGTPDCPGR